LHKPTVPNKPQYHFANEFSSLEELEAISLDLDALRVQSLLICERILGTYHKDMIYRLMYRGAAYADSLQYQVGTAKFYRCSRLESFLDGSVNTPELLFM
jgi:hypothetical protein